ncbi:hypothetical protein AVEN_13716-1 [Araneus ventricosus]|uniref:F-box domain-containing protein n=1 Tax=Araneus ventricosus TaxID=182803 RepID=A0A4Y2SJM7_ARAVE|nr:hypothetical protein AVEN_13716-1 [Araneus ventricosus]
MTELSLYNSCLRKVCRLLKDGIWKSGRVNPFCFLPPEVVHDLVSTTLHLQHPDGFRAADLKLLLTSGMLREFKIHAMDVKQELVPALKSLSSACQNLESLTLTELTFWINTDDSSEALQELLKILPI